MTNYYIEQDGVIRLFDTNKQTLQNTLLFMPQYADIEIQETENEIVYYNDGFVFADTVQSELLADAKSEKYNEATNGATEYLAGGNALYELAEGENIEATDGNIGKLTAYALGFVTGLYKSTDTIEWTTKEDVKIELTQEQLTQVLQGLGAVQAEVWNTKFPAYVAQIEACTTVDEVNAIVVDYSTTTNTDETTETEENNVQENSANDSEVAENDV